MTDATALARALVEKWLDWGVQQVVLCPGSRSAPLAFAAWRAAEAGRVRLHTRIDERTAGFLALGIAKASGRPAVVFTTSGTAAANLHPAVLEAAHAGVPLIVVTADRPASMRGTGANQTTEQVHLFGDAAPGYDIVEPIALALPAVGPVHLNVQFSEPLVPDLDPSILHWPADVPTADVSTAEAEHPTGRLALGPRTVVVAGDDAGPPARLLAQAAGWPLFAEPSSGSRTGDHVIASYRLLLGTDLGSQIQRVVVAGHPTLSRPVAALLARREVEVVSLAARGRWARRPHPVSAEYAAIEHPPADDPAWLARWRAADRAVLTELDTITEDLIPPAVARAVSAAVPPGGLLYVGASNPIRDLDLMAVSPTPGQRRKVLANRGLAGIDGTLSSAIGAALARPGGRNLALVGDVTFLHDLTGLVLGPEEPRPDLTVVVVNDDGGSIFATLEQGGPAYSESFERIFATPHGLDLAAVCASLRVPHWRVESVAELRHALAAPNGGTEVLEVRCRRDDRRARDEWIRSLADRAVAVD